MSNLLKQAICLTWRQVPVKVEALVKAASPAVGVIRELERSGKSKPKNTVFINSRKRKIWLTVDDAGDVSKIEEALRQVTPELNDTTIKHEEEPPDDEKNNGDWVRVKRGALSDWLVPYLQLTGLKEPSPGVSFPGWPSPLAGYLAGGALGAGLGYGTGATLETLLPNNWRRGKLRRTLALLGGLLGAVPAIPYHITNYGEGKNVYETGAWNRLMPKEGSIGAYSIEKLGINLDDRTQNQDISNIELLPNTAGAFFTPSIRTDEFNNVIWQDPHTPPQIQATTTGLVTAAALNRGGFGQRSSFISPFDIARVATAMGSGYISGALVGKTLGVLAGMPDSTQKRLQDVGLFAGLLTSVVPLIFGG